MATVDYFLKIEGIEGESTDTKHTNEIELLSFSFGASNSASFSSGGGGGSGKVTMQDFHFTMMVNKASPKLFLACSNGQHIPTATLVSRKAGKDQQEFLTWKFSDILVSSFSTGGSHGSDVIPVDQVSLAFSKIEIAYKPQKKDGTLDAAINAGWNIKTNAKV